MRVELVIWLLVIMIVIGCSPDYPPCGTHAADEGGGQTEQGPEGPREPDTDPPGTPEPWPSGGELADGEGYRRMSNGEVCSCDLSSPGCSREEPSATGAADGVCDVRAVEGDPDCGPQWSYGQGDADEQTPSICGEVFWCCYLLVAFDTGGKVVKEASMSNVMVCPAQYKMPETRASAWKIFEPQVDAQFYELMFSRPDINVVSKKASNCHQHTVSSIAQCGMYPQ
jgi:hypothetical protein